MVIIRLHVLCGVHIIIPLERYHTPPVGRKEEVRHPEYGSNVGMKGTTDEERVDAS